MKFKPNLVHLAVLSAALSIISVAKGSSVGDALIVVSLLLPALLVTFLNSKKKEEEDTEIAKLTRQLRKKQLEHSYEEVVFQNARLSAKRDAESAGESAEKRFIF